MNWRIKIIIKIILKFLPIPYSFWKKIGLFQHGRMESVDFSYEIWRKHCKNGGVLCENMRFKDGIDVILELGPGDSYFAGIFSLNAGASRAIAIDAGDFADRSENLREAYLLKSNLEFGTNVSQANLEYLTNGLTSFKKIASESIDFSYSNAVLEHILRAEFKEFANELYRVMKKGRCSVHRVDLKDHLGGALNSLRFSNQIWESYIFKNSGFYTNRLRKSEIISIFSDVGFICEVIKEDLWEELPIELRKLNNEFRHFDLDDLITAGFDLKLIK